MIKNVAFSLGSGGTTQYWIRNGKRLIGTDSSSLDLPASVLNVGGHDLSVRLEFANGKEAFLRYRFVIPSDDDWHESQPIDVKDP